MIKKHKLGRPKSQIKMERVNASVTADHYAYLKGHNGSAKIREALDLLISKEEFDNV